MLSKSGNSSTSGEGLSSRRRSSSAASEPDELLEALPDDGGVMMAVLEMRALIEGSGRGWWGHVVR